ncbi:MAG: ABC transporter ATP-binding protein [Clostridiales bacterium]|nr:ABC transporter ATP-binding protein [Clostridiales bacterium]
MSYKTDEKAISVSHVSKVYKIFDTPGKRFLYHMFHTNDGKDFVALNDVSFQVKKGEAFGIIGRNGSGKSTMLQILAGIIKATTGNVEINGRVAALLELGSGFNPESTGYENIYMNAAILGVSKEEIEGKIARIVEFADIGDFVNQPVKTYSSGMFVRLAFSVAINVDADILLIDEALAVGDVFFRQKCYTKLNQLKKEGKTIILVSHGMNEVEQFCDRVLLLNKSNVLMCGDAREAVQRYYMLEQESNASKQEDEFRVDHDDNIENFECKTAFDRWHRLESSNFNCIINYESEINNGKVKFLRVGIFNENGQESKVFQQGENAYFLYEIEVLHDIKTPIAGIVFYDQRNTIVFGKDNLQTYTKVPEHVKKGSVVRCLFKIKMDIAIGEYTFDAGFNSINSEDYFSRSNKKQEEINEAREILCALSNVGSFSVHERAVGKPMKIMFHGCCDLPSDVEMIVN